MLNPDSVFNIWQTLVEGNARFILGASKYSNQDISKRVELEYVQKPIAIVLGCSDSRVAVEMIFDQGLGSIFVIRTAGHIIDNSVLGSIEYAISILGTRLIVVLGHSNCGAVKTTLNNFNKKNSSNGYINNIIEMVTPSMLIAHHKGAKRSDEFEVCHVKETVSQLQVRSTIISKGIDMGTQAIVGATYHLPEGYVELRISYGLFK